MVGILKHAAAAVGNWQGKTLPLMTLITPIYTDQKKLSRTILNL
jgi:hypothetical protein